MEENDGLHTIFERSSRASNTFQDSTIPPSNVRAYKSAMRKPAASSPISQTQYAKISILVGDPNCTTSRVSIWPDPINLLALTASGIPSVTPLRVLLQVRSLLVVCVLFFLVSISSYFVICFVGSAGGWLNLCENVKFTLLLVPQKVFSILFPCLGTLYHRFHSVNCEKLGWF